MQKLYNIKWHDHEWHAGDPGLDKGTISAFSWREWRKQRNISARIRHNPVVIRSGFLPNKSVTTIRNY